MPEKDNPPTGVFMSCQPWQLPLLGHEGVHASAHWLEGITQRATFHNDELQMLIELQEPMASPPLRDLRTSAPMVAIV